MNVTCAELWGLSGVSKRHFVKFMSLGSISNKVFFHHKYYKSSVTFPNQQLKHNINLKSFSSCIIKMFNVKFRATRMQTHYIPHLCITSHKFSKLISIRTCKVHTHTSYTHNINNTFHITVFSRFDFIFPNQSHFLKIFQIDTINKKKSEMNKKRKISHYIL